MARILRDAGLGKLTEEGEPLLIGSGYQFTEGPLWLPDGALLFQDLKAERTYRRVPGGARTEILREATGAANGQTFGPDGKIYFCEQNGRRVSRMDLDGSHVETVAETYEKHRLNSPNDIVCRPDGVLYFTDPPYGVPTPEAKELPFQGVFAIEPGGEPRLVVQEGFEKPNGLAFAPDGRTLYVADTARYHVRAFELDDAGSVVSGSQRVFCTVDPGQPGGPDGVKVDREGRVYVAVALGIWVFDAAGGLLGILALPQRPSNLNWIGHDGSSLVVTAVDQVFEIRLRTQGLVPPFLPNA